MNKNTSPTEPGDRDNRRTLRIVSSEELNEIIALHSSWFKSGERDGKKCDLQNANLRGVDLSKALLADAILTGADLSGANLDHANLERIHLGDAILRHTSFNFADLSEAVLSSCEGQDSSFIETNLEKADLRRANFEGANFQRAKFLEADLEHAGFTNANLQRTDFSKSNLAKTNLRQADLSNAKLRETNNLATNQLAGVNIAGASLPEEISRFDGLAQVAELSKMGKTLFTSMLLGCLYSWLTIFSTKDAHLVTNSTSSPLPIIQTPVPIADFYLVALFILLALFGYFQFYLDRLWRQLANLPAIFPDGKPLEEKAYPWLLNSLLGSNVSRFSIDHPILSHFEVRISVLLAWYAVPLTIAIFWIRSLQKHDPILTGCLIVWMSLSIWLASWFLHHAQLTLRGQPQAHLGRTIIWALPKIYKIVVEKIWWTQMVAVVLLALIIADGAFNGAKLQDGEGCPRAIATEEESDGFRLSHVTNFHKEIVPRFLPCIGARAFADLTEQTVSQKPPNWFSRPDDELYRIVQGAQLKGADLRHASARRTFLIKAELSKAQLSGANLAEAQIQGANLKEAQLQKADLSFTNLGEANLAGAHLQEANLSGAQLEKVDLSGAQLNKANLFGTMLKRANLSGATLQQVRLTNSLLQNAILIGTVLDGADLAGAQLDGAQLQRASLKDVKGLTQLQINLACIDSDTILPPELSRPKPCRTQLPH